MGTVYQAYDRQRKEEVALKTLLHADPTAIYLFKREFRTLADIVHPNLVGLYELLYEEGHWFFTMELLDGVDFLTYVRAGVEQRVASVSTGDTATTAVELTRAVDRSQVAVEPALAPLQLQRLRAALAQLAEGLTALHDRGYLHRDLKPSNVMITVAQRLVILDFGLSSRVSGRREEEVGPLLGTPAYMAPEYVAPGDAPVTTASDWYAVGVMLFEALTGRPPFTGSFAEMTLAKYTEDAPRPSALVPGVPADLDELCVALLQRFPSVRPATADVLRMLRVNPSAPVNLAAAEVKQGKTLIGREREMEEFASAYSASCAGRALVVSVFGPSGMGKSALVRAGLDHIAKSTPPPLVLSARCYEHESVPYKAIDGIIDQLTQHLLSLPRWQTESMLPPTIRSLAVLFPVLLRVDAIAAASDFHSEGHDPLALRRMAFAALRELFVRIARRQPLVLVIDDLQWSDADSLSLIDDLLQPPYTPALLLVLTFRSEELEARPFLKAFVRKERERRVIELGPLSAEDSRALAVGLLESVAAEAAPAAAETVVLEAAGNPFLIEYLAGCYAYRPRDTSGLSLAEMLELRLAHLPQRARDVLDVLAVAARPTTTELAASALDEGAATRALTAALRAAQLIRSVGALDRVEVYHDRLREALVRRLPPERVTRIHANLAAAIARSGADDPEALCHHYLEAGEREPAATAALAAARRAASALAFDRAAFFYRRAAELGELSPQERAARLRLLGEALANAGRTLEAARVFLDAAGASDQSTALELRRRAAEQLLLGGHVDGGVDVMRSVLAAVGISVPRGPRRALLGLVFRRQQIRLRGFQFTERQPGEVDEGQLRRVDACWAASIGLGLVDLVSGAYFQSTQLLLALQAGDPYRVARALAVEAASVATSGGPAEARAAQILRLAEALARRVGDPHAEGLCALAGGMSAFLAGHWNKCVKLSDEAGAIFRERCTGVTWEQTNAMNFALGGLLYLGELAELDRRLGVWLPDARERGNLYSITEAQTRYNLCWLAAGQVEAAREELSQARERWSHRGFHRQHYNALLAEAQIELYAGHATDALRIVELLWRDLSRSLLMRVQVLRIEAHFLRARTRLAVAAQKSDRRLIAAAERDAKAIAAEGMFWAAPLADLLRAGAASLRGQEDTAIAHLTRAVDGFELAGMRLYARAAGYALGQRIGGDQGQRLVDDARLWMQTEHIRDPDRLSAMLAPALRLEAPV